MENKKRTDLDFSQHILIESHLKDEETGKEVDIYKLCLPDSSVHSFIFINTCGIMSVTGDYGNWIFDREFHPSGEKQKVDDSYWLGKLQLGSVQKVSEYSPKETEKEIDELINGGIEDYFGEYDDRVLLIINKLKELKSYIDDEHEYIYRAFRDYDLDLTSYLDYDMIPFVKVPVSRINYVFDAFDEINKRKSCKL